MDALLARHSLVESELASGLSPEAYVKLGVLLAQGLGVKADYAEAMKCPPRRPRASVATAK